MPDEIIPAAPAAPPEPATVPEPKATPVEGAAKASGSPAAKSGKAAPAEPPTLEQLLESADPDTIRKHPKVAGIVGGMLRSERQTWEQQQKAEADRAAREAADAAIEDMARTRPLEFADKYLTDKEQARIKAQLDGIRATTAQEYMAQIGKGFGEQYQLTTEEITEISKALAGKSDAEVLPAFNVAASEIVAKRKADALFAEWRTKELPKEREAIRQELAAKRLQRDQRPSLAKPSAGATTKPHQLEGKAFDDWYEVNVLKHAKSSSA